MSHLSFDHLPAWAVLISLSVHFGIGIVLGVVHFRGLWWNTRRFAEGRQVATTIAVMIGRFVLLGGLLALASLEGALPLLVTTLGVLIARYVVMRGIREAAP